MNKAILKFSTLTLTLIPLDTFAHVRWFVEEQHKATNFTLDATTFLLVGGTLFYIFFCCILNAQKESRNKDHVINRFLFGKLNLKGIEWKIFEASIVIMLIGNITAGIFIAPNLILEDKDLSFLIQGGLIVCLIFDRVLFSIGLLALTGILISIFGLNLSIDYAAEFISFSLAFALIGCYKSWTQPEGGSLSWRAISVNASSTLRIGMGIQLVILAMHNKFLNPDMGLVFLQENQHFNFMKLLGVETFKDIHFVLAAGLAEMSFGLLLLLNIATRFVASCVFGIFLLTSIILGIHELLGHLPILACTFVIWLNGNSTENLDLKLKWIILKGKSPFNGALLGKPKNVTQQAVDH